MCPLELDFKLDIHVLMNIRTNHEDCMREHSYEKFLSVGRSEGEYCVMPSGSLVDTGALQVPTSVCGGDHSGIKPRLRFTIGLGEVLGVESSRMNC